MQLFYVSNIKEFMGALLKGSLFDCYEARGLVLHTFTRFDISCASENQEDGTKPKYCLWSEIRPIALNLVRGKTPPRFLKIGLCLSGQESENTIPNAASLHLTITYDCGKMTVLTGSSQKNFTLDKTVDNEWDRIVLNIFKQNGFQTRETEDVQL